MTDRPWTGFVSDAIEAGDLPALRNLLDDNIDRIQWKSSFTVNWLYYACGCSTLEVVEYLHNELGLDPNEDHSEFGNSLSNAAFSGKAEIARYLLSRNVEMNVSEPERNPLLAAISGDGTIEIVRMLLEAGIDSTVKYNLRGADKPMGAVERAVEQGRRDIAGMIEEWNRKAS